MSEHRTALITGANTGIGFETAAGLGRLGWHVGIGARSTPKRDDAVARLRAAGIDAFGVPLDVTDDGSVSDAAWLLAERGGLDVLVNNAAIAIQPLEPPTRTNLAALHACLDTNVGGVIRMTNAVVGLLRQSPAPRIVNMSSSIGSLGLHTTDESGFGDLDLTYSASKTLLNAVTVGYAKELRSAGVLVNSACPGYVSTAINGFAGFRTPAQGAAIAIRLATLGPEGPTGGFFNEVGEIPW